MDVWSFLGTLGVTMLIMESGMHINFEKVASVGVKACVVAVLGTVCPLLVGMGLTNAFFPGKLMPDGLSAGVALAPTSVGISIKLLSDAKMLNSIAGQTVLTAAFVDDVFSLILLVLLSSLASGSTDAGPIIGLMIAAFAFLGAGVALAKFVYPRLVPRLVARFVERPAASIQPRDELQLLTMFVSLFGFAYIGSYIGSHLLGAFVAGMCYTQVPRSHHIWSHQMKRPLQILVRIFFACTVGFAVPVQEMLTLNAFLRGLAIGAAPGIMCKLISGIAVCVQYKNSEARRLAAKSSWLTFGGRVRPLMYLVGTSMIARGEFAFLVAYTARNMEVRDEDGNLSTMMGPDTYAMVTWALVWALILAPFMFKWALRVYANSAPIRRASVIGGESFRGDDFLIRVVGDHHTGMLHDLLDSLHAQDLDVLEARAEVKGDIDDKHHKDSDIFVVRPRGKQKDFDEEKLKEIKHELEELMGDGTQIMFQAIAHEVTEEHHRAARQASVSNSATAADAEPEPMLQHRVHMTSRIEIIEHELEREEREHRDSFQAPASDAGALSDATPAPAQLSTVEESI